MNGNDRSRYWKGPDKSTVPGDGEFAEELPRGTFMLKRRDFLHVAGFAAAVAATTGCSRAPVQNAIPMLVQPEQLVPGTSLHYATTCGGCSAGCGVLAKVRDGRPIKLEGNPQHPLSRGGLCAVGQASLLGLYDSQRLKSPLRDGKEVAWEALDTEVTSAFSDLRAKGGSLRLLTGSITSPTTRSVVDQFLNTFPNAKHVQYDAVSYSAILDAHERTHNIRAVPHFHFDRAAVIVAVDADFLGTWLSPVEYTAAYREGRKLNGARSSCSWHVQFESRMSLTGSKADERYTIGPAERSELLRQIADRIESLANGRTGLPARQLSVPPSAIEKVARKLWETRGRSIVVSGSNDVDEQLVINRLNHLLGNYGTTVDLTSPSYQAVGSDQALSALFDELQQGKVDALLVAGVNPVFDLPFAIDAIKHVPLVISFAQRMDETSLLAKYVAPGPHFLETWSDAEPVAGIITSSQPMVQQFGQTRTLAKTLSKWMGTSASDQEIMRQYWKMAYFPRQKYAASFDAFWDRSIQDGFFELAPALRNVAAFHATPVGVEQKAASRESGAYSLVLYPTMAMRGGSEAYNSWLHELPDPITKVTWDNYACVSPATATKMGLAEGDVVRISSGQLSLELPTYIQPGQHNDVVAVPLGYGSVLSKRFANIGPHWIDALPSVGTDGCVGKNAAGFVVFAGTRRFELPVRIQKTGSRQILASTQLHHELSVPETLAKLNPEPRPIIQETTLAAYKQNPNAGVHEHEEREDLWPADHPYKGHRWAMVVDLEACSGCSACVIACQAENNIPVVGKDEIRRNREMHWMRIDRYYSNRPDGRVDVAFQPVMCQQCENAPCETVCPVLATVHSEEGLSQQVYNRCVGTRYCANNCPYKGRRFNWFNYSRDDKLQNLVLNPDVTVRSRGVMEKCSFCVQRIEAARIDAKCQGRDIADGDIQTACQQSCPAKAIYFGDINDPKSEVAKKMRDPRRYRVLSELNLRPAVGYLTIVRNRDENKGGEHHG
ncbi:MAG TPA: 4Fe-4S dicluster domain-containing protein [Terriglobales bacterium]|nr:4Fe-4S dicluster domain-containing protein [Terriglobales bacterium]